MGHSQIWNESDIYNLSYATHKVWLADARQRHQRLRQTTLHRKKLSHKNFSENSRLALPASIEVCSSPTTEGSVWIARDILKTQVWRVQLGKSVG